MLKLMYITNDVKVAKIAEYSGVNRIFVDLEYLGKEERQKNMDTVKSKHCEEDIDKIAEQLSDAELLVRVNPINDDSEREIESVINRGADIVMLPMFKTCSEVESFLEMVDGRAKNILLLEHIDAVEELDNILKIDGIDEIHIGLNDLHLSMGLTFMFELLSNGVVESISKKIKEKGIPFGIGGISRLGSGTLPAEYIIAEHYRLGSSMAILSRSFCNVERINDFKKVQQIFSEGIAEIRQYEKELDTKTDSFFIENRKKVGTLIEEITNNM